MQVHERRSRGVIQILGMNMKKRRLIEAPEKGGRAQDCATYLHKCLYNLSDRRSCRIRLEAP